MDNPSKIERFQAFLNVLHGRPGCVILSGNRIEIAKLIRENPGLESLFPFRLEFENLTAEQIYQIVKSKLECMTILFEN